MTADEQEQLHKELSWLYNLDIIDDDGNDVSEYVVTKLADYISQQRQKAAREARESVHHLYKKEMQHLKSFQEAVIKKEATKTNVKLVVCDFCAAQLQGKEGSNGNND